MPDLKDILTGSELGEFEHRVSQGPSPFARAARERAGGKPGKPAGKPVTTVGRSAEFIRIEALPRRTLDLTTVQDVTEMFRRPGGTESLFPIQSAALLEAAMLNGGFVNVQVGGGKTLVTLLLPTALDSTCTVLLMPTQLKRKTLKEIDSFYSKHFILPLDALNIIAYEELSLAKSADILDRLKPDLIIADEAHKLRHRSAARTKRFLRFMKDNPGTRFVPLSGTMTAKSVADYAHLIELALRKSSPLPRGYREVLDWAGALDVKPEYEVGPGALLRFCLPGEEPRSGFRRRLVETPGVIASTEESIGTSLIVEKLRLAVPPEVKKIIDEVNKSWSLEGDEFSDILTKIRVLRQLACGFYYKWAWPNGEIDFEWLTARSNWNRAVREKLKQSRVDLDSPSLLEHAADRAMRGVDGVRWEGGVEAWREWKPLKHKKPPPIETRWVSDFLMLDVIRRAKNVDAPCIVWYEHRAIGERLGKLSGWTVYGEGADATDSREQVIVASIHTQREGKNLQGNFSRNIYTSLPANADMFEQSIGRTHRTKQLADEVIAWWYGHTPECEAAMVSVIEQAKYKRETTGTPQKVLFATHLEES